MVIRRVDGKLVAEVERSLIYLDHWALRQFSSEMICGQRMLNVLSRRGTLLFSVINFAEVRRNSGLSHERIVAFLREVGPPGPHC